MTTEILGYKFYVADFGNIVGYGKVIRRNELIKRIKAAEPQSKLVNEYYRIDNYIDKSLCYDDSIEASKEQYKLRQKQKDILKELEISDRFNSKLSEIETVYSLQQQYRVI